MNIESWSLSIVCAKHTIVLSLLTIVCAKLTIDLSSLIIVCAKHAIDLSLPIIVCAKHAIDLSSLTIVCAKLTIDLSTPLIDRCNYAIASVSGTIALQKHADDLQTPPIDLQTPLTALHKHDIAAEIEKNSMFPFNIVTNICLTLPGLATLEGLACSVTCQRPKVLTAFKNGLTKRCVPISKNNSFSFANSLFSIQKGNNFKLIITL